jgi:hypothetical protein
MSGSETDDRAGQSLQFTTPASPVLYVGPSGVTSGNGYALAASTEYFYDLGPGDVLFVVAASGSLTLPVLHTGY